MTLRSPLICGSLLSVALLSTSARANPYDISLLGLGVPTKNSSSDPAVKRYRSLASELAIAITPKPMEPAETLGMSGFEFAFSNTFTGIHGGALYWQGQPGMPVMEGVLPNHGSHTVPNELWTPTLQYRKGLPLSTEIGVSASYLAYTNMYMLSAEAKVAIYESFFHYFPAIALRAAIGRLFGSHDLDLVTCEADAMASFAFGIGGMIQATVFGGYGQMYTQVNSAVLDATPNTVADNYSNSMPGGSLYTFPTIKLQDNMLPRAIGGIRLNISMIELMYEFDWTSMPFLHSQLMSHTLKIGFDV
jgi:hypothetical protein